MSKDQELELPDDILNAIECGNKFKLPIVLLGKSIDDSQVISILKTAQEPFVINLYSNDITDYGALILANFGTLYFSLKEFTDDLIMNIEPKNMVFIGNNLISKEFANNYKCLMDNNYNGEIVGEERNNDSDEPSAKRMKLQDVQDLIQQTLTNTSTLANDSMNVDENDWSSESNFTLNISTDQTSQNLSGDQNNDEWFSKANLN